MDKNMLRNLLIHYEMLVVDQRNRIINLRLQTESENSGRAVEIVKDFCKVNEEIYLKLKSLMYEVQDEKPVNMIAELGTTEAFPSSLTETEKGVWKFHLPPFYSVSAKRKLYNEGKHVYYLVMNLLDRYERENRKIQKLNKPVVIFRHHIASDSPNIFDFDNIDSKRAIDAMQGYFLKDDNAQYLTVIHESVHDEHESFCDIYVLDKAGQDGLFSKKIADLLY